MRKEVKDSYRTMLTIFTCGDQLMYIDVLCVCDNRYVLLTQLSEVLQSRMTSEPACLRDQR